MTPNSRKCRRAFRAYYHHEMSEFLPTDEMVPEASNPGATIESFVDSTDDGTALERARP